jgi:transcriptional regulator with XRE-family HTH domain
MSDIAKNPLRPVRDSLGYSREYVTRRLNPPRTAKTLDRWERGEVKPKHYYLVQLAEIYGVPIEQLQADNGQP